ncbi:hypothetical protein PENTCL1PPCAC_20752, partial [Pristionchus entomophagus]
MPLLHSKRDKIRRKDGVKSRRNPRVVGFSRDTVVTVGRRLSVRTLLEVHEVDEEGGADERGLGANREIEREADSEVVGVSECLLNESRPLLANRADLSAAVGANIEDLVATAAHRARARTLAVENHLSILVAHLIGAGAARDALIHRADHISGWCLDGERVRAACARDGAPKAAATEEELAVDAHHFLSIIIDDVHGESTLRSAALTRAASRLLVGVVDLLSDSIHDDILVVRLPAESDLEQLPLLFYLHIIDHGEILEARRAVASSRRLLHPIASVLDGRSGLQFD